MLVVYFSQPAVEKAAVLSEWYATKAMDQKTQRWVSMSVLE